MSKDLKILPLTKNMLRDAIDHNTYWKDSIIPLPKSKALWIVSNDRIEDDDYCGVLGFENDKMISFIFMFPDQLRVCDKEFKKIYWMILWWVTDTYKDTVLGTYIYNEAINLTGKQVLIKSYAENVNDFYEKQPFDIIASRLRYTIFFSLDSSILIGRFSFLKYFKVLIDKTNVLVHKIVELINRGKLKKSTKELSYDYITQLDRETWEFIEPLCKDDLIHKTKDYVNWQINNLQYTQIPIVKKYPFHSLQVGNGQNIRIHNVKVILDHTLIGFLSFTVNGKEFNVKYFLVKDDKNYNICVDALIAHHTNAKTNFIFTDDSRLADTINKRFKTIFTYKVMKKALAHKAMQLEGEKHTIYNRDGHFY